MSQEIVHSLLRSGHTQADAERTAGLTDADPNAAFRRDMCTFADDRPTDAQKVEFMHAVLQRDAADVRMLLEHLEHYLAFARDADESTVPLCKMALARQLGWLTSAQAQTVFLRRVSDRMARGTLGRTEVDLVGTAHMESEPGLARQFNVAHSTVLACLISVARSLEMQRAIAGILIRADTSLLGRADLARSLRLHRLKSPDGADVIDMLIHVLQSTLLCGVAPFVSTADLNAHRHSRLAGAA